MNGVVARLTLATLLGRRRVLALLALPAVLLAVAVVVRLLGGLDERFAAELLDGLGLGTMLPVLCVVVGTGVVSPEIEDGSIVYLLSKPVPRGAIVRTKLAVAVVTCWALGALPVALAGLVLGVRTEAVLAVLVVAAVAAAAYSAVFVLLGVVTGNAVVVGLLYALIWETTVAGLVPGARALSVRQWATAVGEQVLGPEDAAVLGLTSEVAWPVAVVLLVLTVAAATWWATRRLHSLPLGAPE